MPVEKIPASWMKTDFIKKKSIQAFLNCSYGWNEGNYYYSCSYLKVQGFNPKPFCKTHGVILTVQDSLLYKDLTVNMRIKNAVFLLL